jgi:hypothetical protein
MHLHTSTPTARRPALFFFLPRADSADEYSECGGDADIELDDEAERGEDDADAADGQADASGAPRCTRQLAQAAAMNVTGVLRRQRHCAEHADAGVCMCVRSREDADAGVCMCVRSREGKARGSRRRDAMSACGLDAVHGLFQASCAASSLQLVMVVLGSL